MRSMLLAPLQPPGLFPSTTTRPRLTVPLDRFWPKQSRGHEILGVEEQEVGLLPVRSDTVSDPAPSAALIVEHHDPFSDGQAEQDRPEGDGERHRRDRRGAPEVAVARERDRDRPRPCVSPAGPSRSGREAAAGIGAGRGGRTGVLRSAACRTCRGDQRRVRLPRPAARHRNRSLISVEMPSQAVTAAGSGARRASSTRWVARSGARGPRWPVGVLDSGSSCSSISASHGALSSGCSGCMEIRPQDGQRDLHRVAAPGVGDHLEMARLLSGTDGIDGLHLGGCRLVARASVSVRRVRTSRTVPSVRAARMARTIRKPAAAGRDEVEVVFHDHARAGPRHWRGSRQTPDAYAGRRSRHHDARPPRPTRASRWFVDTSRATVSSGPMAAMRPSRTSAAAPSMRFQGLRAPPAASARTGW